jgi:hypothetical protein
MQINQSINQFRRHGPIWAFAISWLNLLWWRVSQLKLVQIFFAFWFCKNQNSRKLSAEKRVFLVKRNLEIIDFNTLRTDGDFCHQWQDAEIAQII